MLLNLVLSSITRGQSENTKTNREVMKKEIAQKFVYYQVMVIDSIWEIYIIYIYIYIYIYILHLYKYQ